MVDRSLRTVLCVLVGVVVGAVLGPLLPDPTGLLAAALAVVVAVAVGGVLRRSDWLRDVDLRCR
ncbi:hypothetical protein EI982_05320 [Haloplanus rallus]|uniref:DUF1427 family protein n=1 Tax=Haloplanus rallus TaxID=1816183 RepID=A0A6B9F747_9EURY|nr:hypothetical protein [Haloplanus rallus]QGX94247.1 hypothetical protein EI982_05320 [Haloplanus rallus]